ncbi:acyltransferase [Winogradskya consettensis]|uniref:Acyltransferase n=1 Tax=Winogradskya consettensis TaxID=113560 RepID=A0A919SF70_9ACTN|nr:acyltransferase [Actinoplanes consettensis]GIM70544.1 acyltransferase [Actinoplanes consettensis]
MTTDRKPRLAALDGLRLVAALSVAVFHYTTFWAVDGVHTPAYYLPQASRVTVYGFLGVELFFMISGFAICMSSWGRSLGHFFASRASRLYPAYWICIVITLAVTSIFPLGGYVPVNDHFSLSDIAVNFTMLQYPMHVPDVDNVYWTLWVELRFYLLFGLVVAKGVSYRRTVIFCGVWMVAAAVSTTVNSTVFTMVTVPQFAPCFVAGIAMYLMHRFGANPLLWGIVGFSWLMNVHSLSSRVQIKPGWHVPLWPAVLLITLGYAILLLIALGKTDRITWRWLTVAGALTFPYYLLHQRIGYILIRHGQEHLPVHLAVLVAATVLIMLVPAWLVYRFVERPFGPRLRRALTSGLNLPTVPAQRNSGSLHLETGPPAHRGGGQLTDANR